jgi:hypothetical protein
MDDAGQFVQAGAHRAGALEDDARLLAETTTV